MSRPERLTPERVERFLQAIRAGAFPETAARYAGISSSTYYRAMQAKTPDHARFRDSVLEAQTELEIRLVATIATESTQPRWALALLERRFRARWGRAASPEAPPDESTDAVPRPADEVLSLDPAFVEALVPRLLEARDRLAARTSTAPDLSNFLERRPRSAGDAKP